MPHKRLKQGNIQIPDITGFFQIMKQDFTLFGVIGKPSLFKGLSSV